MADTFIVRCAVARRVVCLGLLGRLLPRRRAVLSVSSVLFLMHATRTFRGMSCVLWLSVEILDRRLPTATRRTKEALRARVVLPAHPPAASPLTLDVSTSTLITPRLLYTSTTRTSARCRNICSLLIRSTTSQCPLGDRHFRALILRCFLSGVALQSSTFLLCLLSVPSCYFCRCIVENLKQSLVIWLRSS